MKILFIGHYREQSGWGLASRNYLLALKATGLDVVARCVKPNPATPSVQLSPEILELEANNEKGCNICIQHLLPHLMSYNGNFDKNIALFVTESRAWWHSGWHHHLNCFDEIWVPNYQLYQAKMDNILRPPTFVIPHACNPKEYKKEYEPLYIPELDGNFVFYHIGELIRRKRVSAIIQAYYLAFTKNEPVSLLLKINKPGSSSEEIYNEIQAISNEIKRSHKLYGKYDHYPSVTIIPEYIPEINSVHTVGDCYVNASFGEAWEQSCFSAMGFSKFVISNDEGGPHDYLKTYNKGRLIKNDLVPCIGANETFPFLNTGKDRWSQIDINHLTENMKDIYNNRDNCKISSIIKESESDIIPRYSYEHIAKKMKERLNAH